MALKLGKCRLCLKLGDFYSIFTVDNSIQLAEMAMDCSKIKIYEGDGLPDKVCAECIAKLSSAYIFKQQCERSDQELRRNYVPPPGFSVSPSNNRQSSDSGFSNRTDVSNQNKPTSSHEEKFAPAALRNHRKRSRESDDSNSVSSRFQDNKFKEHPASRRSRVSELRSLEKRPRLESENTSMKESDYEDNNSASHYSADSDSDEPVLHKCDVCNKEFASKQSMSQHKRVHSRKSEQQKNNLGQDVVVDIPPMNYDGSEDEKLACTTCGKIFKLKIMLNRHQQICTGSPQKELKISLELLTEKKIVCKYCGGTFKAIENLEKHMRVVHAAVLKEDKQSTEEKTVSITVPAKQQQRVPCIFCHKPFDDYYVHAVHFNSCNNRSNIASFSCLVCSSRSSTKKAYFKHLHDKHFTIQERVKKEEGAKAKAAEPEPFECRMCNQKLGSQDALITHLAAHMSNIDDGAIASTAGEDSRASTQEDSTSLHSEKSGTLPAKCEYCDKVFTYRKSLTNHIMMKHSRPEEEPKTEPPDIPVMEHDEPESEDSSQDDGDNTCDICEKQFSYKRVLIQHKKTKHNISSGTKRVNFTLKDCLVKCLICDLDMKVGDTNVHNRQHLAKNMKPRNLYTCMECEDTFKSCSNLANHIKWVHRLKRQVTPKFQVADLADFCEVVVTKREPLDTLQSHNDFDGVPGTADDGLSSAVDLGGFTCPICGKQMNTLLSLKRHVGWHNNVGNNIQKIIECFVCNETFRFNRHYKLHMRQHYHDTNLDPKFLTCEICNRKSKHLRAAQMHMKYHNQTRFKTKDYQCAICNRMFQNRKVYLSHMSIHYKKGETIQNTIIAESAGNSLQATDDPLKCQHCGKICDSEASLKCHMSWHRSKTSMYCSRYQCQFCGLQFTNKKRQELHLRTHYEDDNGPFKCQICGKGYTDENYFRRHVKGHNFDHSSHQKRLAKLRQNKVKCPICIRYYPDLVKLIRHLRRTHPESKMIKEDPDAPAPQVYPCKLCAKVFATEKRLQHHGESHLRKLNWMKCKFCGKKTASLKSHRIHIKGHLTEKHVDNPLKCPKCDETFIRGYSLHYHLRDVHQIEETWMAELGEEPLNGPLKEFQCSICHKILASKGNFERHIDYHNSLRCNYCFEYFNALRFVEGHLAFNCEKRRLIGETEVYPKKVKCDICYKAFHLQVKLDCHLRTQHGIKVTREAEEGSKRIVCDYCFRVFENEDALAGHKVYHRTIGYFGCMYCSRKFNTVTLYRKHKNHHFAQLNVDNPTKCEHCPETFVAFRDFIYHMRDDHGDSKDWIIMPKESIEEQCNICHKTFFNLHRHLQYHEENRCKKCGEYFYSRADFDNHLCAIESDEDPDTNEKDIRPKYDECEFCFKPTTKTNSKLKHNLIHKSSGSISCRFCALKFNTIDAFNIHAFSHRNRKYRNNPIRCRVCKEKFIQYGSFMRHMKTVHKIKEKMHYRSNIVPERCAICSGLFPNLHNHYRAHLQHQCQLCRKYFTSNKVFLAHECGKPDLDPSKVFTFDENLLVLINSYIPKDDSDEYKYYGNYNEDEEPEPLPKPQNDRGQNLNDNELPFLPISIQSPIISDVLSLYEENGKNISLFEEDVKNISLYEEKEEDVNVEEVDVVEIIDEPIQPGEDCVITIDDD